MIRKRKSVDTSAPGGFGAGQATGNRMRDKTRVPVGYGDEEKKPYGPKPVSLPFGKVYINGKLIDG